MPVPAKPFDKFSSVEEAVNLLQQGMIDIYFIKRTTGASRHLRCTLSPRLVPERAVTTAIQITSTILTLNSDGIKPIAVWDLEHSGWRSFYLDSTYEIILSQIDFQDARQEDEEEEADAEIEEELNIDEFSDVMPERDDMIYRITENIKDRVKDKIQSLPDEAMDALRRGGSKMVKEFISSFIKTRK